MRAPSQALAILVVSWLTGCSREADDVSRSSSEPKPVASLLNQEARLERMALAEDWLSEHSPKLKKLKRSVLNLRLPDPESADLFAADFTFKGETSLLDSEKRQTGLTGVTISKWQAAPDGESASASSSPLWESLLGETSYFTAAKFYFESATFPFVTLDTLTTLMGFEGLARREDGTWQSIRLKADVTWETRGEQWKMIQWSNQSIEIAQAPALFFEEKLEVALPKQSDFQRARFSYHEDNLIKLFTVGKFEVTHPPYARYQDLESSHQHPGLAVVDIDADGWDDLYVMGRWGANQLLHNQRNGTFRDIAPELGLDLRDFCNSAIFADFDNDGDPDAFIGRSLKRSLYLENVNGRFVDRSKERVQAPLPYFVSSISAADFNHDGLLDVYLSLYGPTAQNEPVEQWANEFFPPAMAKELIRRAPQSHRYLDRLGPPNLLLENRGGRFVVSSSAAVLAEWRNTYQSVWSDYDEDGDVDVYICNDFAPDSLFRNEGKDDRGRVRFQEVSQEVAGNAMNGFGMGASWADYNQDGRLDLYVSNMFSKAGRRITSQIDGLDERVPYAAQGSLLFRQNEGTFSQVAGTSINDVAVARVGWSFGGQFIDVDNDSLPDIYSASGYYTAPDVTRSDQDL